MPSWPLDRDPTSSGSFRPDIRRRALYACQQGDQLSKKQAALWAQRAFPAWADLIQNALIWRLAPDDAPVDHQATYLETVRFVEFARERILGQTHGG